MSLMPTISISLSLKGLMRAGFWQKRARPGMCAGQHFCLRPFLLELFFGHAKEKTDRTIYAFGLMKCLN
jgi:hypothetical protein